MRKFLMLAGLSSLVAAASAKADDVSHAPPKPGLYECYHGTAGTSKIVFGEAGAYASSDGVSGAYDFDATTSEFAFTSGHLEGFYGIAWGDGSVGLASRKDGGWNSHCRQ